MDKVEIYALLCPNTKEVRYIGKANDSQKRLKSHIRDSRRRNTPVYCWIRKLCESDQIPIIKVLHVCEKTNWQELEIKEIQIQKESGARLLNIALGGDEPFCSKEQRAINGRNVSKMIHSDPFRKKVWHLKKSMCHHLHWLRKEKKVDRYNELLVKMHYCANKRPDIFSVFLNYELL